MKKALLKYICSPGTGNPLELEADEVRGEEIISGQLIDRRTGNQYPIIGGIPRFITPEEMRGNYTSSFDEEWLKFNWLRDEDSREFEAITDKRLPDFKNKAVLDAGCGGGRVARFLAERSGLYIGIDYSIACEKAYALCSHLPNTHFMQADLNNLPFPSGPLVDFIFCYGVLHHTPEPALTFRNLPPLLRGGGELYVMVYRKPFFMLGMSDHFFRGVINKMPFRLQDSISGLMTGLQRLPWPSFWKRFFWFSLQKNAEYAKFCNYDWYTPQYHFEFRVEEVMDWFQKSGFEGIKYINAWPYAPPGEKYRLPRFKDSFRLGQILGVIGRKS